MRFLNFSEKATCKCVSLLNIQVFRHVTLLLHAPCHIPEDSNIQQHCCENLKSCMFICFQTKRKQQKIYKETLMLSEWLVHVPEDLAELWYLVPCPEGRRTLVVATAVSCKSYRNRVFVHLKSVH
jgi:hypothetical protein